MSNKCLNVTEWLGSGINHYEKSLCCEAGIASMRKLV